MQEVQDGNAKQQVVERIKNTTNILVTVSRNPSVDELSAALALTLMLNKMDKHATAVFSGALPPAISFLEPNKTFEPTVDSLRDFIIALDKDKADRLRYKVEDDVVRIFITPYKTTITEKDLKFSQGDFNVELIIALGVDMREDLDTAITAHGRILHDATVVTINIDEEKNTLGSIDWQDSAASSYSEMLVSLSEALQTGALDSQIATALLTGIVAATKRFANTHTTPRVMTMAAQLMAAGANQQLIASKLEEAQAIPPKGAPIDKDGTTRLDEGKSKKLEKPQPPKKGDKSDKNATPAPEVKEEAKANGEMQITHEAKAPEAPVPQLPTPAPEPKKKTDEEAERELDEAIAAVTEPLEKPQQLAPPAPAPSEPKPAPAAPAAPSKSNVSVDDLKKDLAAASREVDAAAAGVAPEPSTLPPVVPSKAPPSKDWRDQALPPPSLGGTLNATAEEAAEQKRREEMDDRNRMILTHDKPAMGAQSEPQSPFNSYAAGGPSYEPPTVDPFATPAPAAPGEDSSLGDARQAVEQALSAVPFDAAHQPLESVGAQPFPPLHEAPATPPVGDALALPPPPPPPAGDASLPLPPPAAPEPAMAPMAPQPAAATTPAAGPAPATLPPITPPVTTPASNDPGQFKIPGQ